MCEILGGRVKKIVYRDGFDLETKEGFRRIVRGESFLYDVKTKEFLPDPDLFKEIESE